VGDYRPSSGPQNALHPIKVPPIQPAQAALPQQKGFCGPGAKPMHAIAETLQATFTQCGTIFDQQSITQSV
jgi:hypothetical protein